MPREGYKIAVCACTFRRPKGLAALLAGLNEQRFRRIPAPRVLIIIVDNDGSADAQALCKAAAAEQGLRVRYVVEDRRGISFARNCCLEAVPVDADFIAMIDDDERPDPEWLEELLLAQAATGADVVQGRVEPVFAGSVPAWIRDGGFFGYPKQPSPFHHDSWADLQEVPAAASGNVLIHAAAISVLGLRFDPRLGLTGGSDALFFRALRAAGNRIVYAKRAVVHEDVPATARR